MDTKQVNFLDTTVYVTVEQTLAVKVYHKPTDRNSLLHFKSFHPWSLVNNLPYGQFLHLKRNSTRDQHFQEESNTLSRQLKQRGYPHKVINEALCKAQRTKRESLLMNKQRLNRNNKICWGLDYTPLTMDIKKIICQHWHIIEEIPGCHIKPYVGFCRTRKLKDLLMFQKPKEENRETDKLPEGFFACGHCYICKLAIRSDSFTHNGINISNKKFATCSTRNVIYYVKCGCVLAYIGYTKRMIRTRTGEHKSRIRNKVLEAPMVSHFVNARHMDTDFSFWFLEQTTSRPGLDIQRQLLQWEAYWIFKLNTVKPHGLNVSQDLSCFL